jgi:hypothetical protein
LSYTFPSHAGDKYKALSVMDVRNMFLTVCIFWSCLKSVGLFIFAFFIYSMSYEAHTKYPVSALRE